VTPEPARLPLVLGLVRAVAVIILAIMTVSNTVLVHQYGAQLGLDASLLR
jgi:hypothetical protein